MTNCGNRKKAKAVESQEKKGESGRKGGFEVKQGVLKEGYNFSAIHSDLSEILVLVKYLIYDSSTSSTSTVLIQILEIPNLKVLISKWFQKINEISDDILLPGVFTVTIVIIAVAIVVAIVIVAVAIVVTIIIVRV